MRRPGVDNWVFLWTFCSASRSIWARVARTAGPLLMLRVRNWMPPASAHRPIMPPRASISRTMWPLARPPMAGLQDR